MFFTIDTDNSITAHEVAPPAQDGLILFATERQFAKVAADWPINRLVETWNGFAGVAGPFASLKPVKKFTDRKTAVARIWTAIQKLAPVPAPAAKPATEKAAAGTADKQERAERAPRHGTQKAAVIEMLKREGGATLDEIIAATGWQKHTVRGFISTLGKTGLAISSTRRDSDKARVYAAQ